MRAVRRALLAAALVLGLANAAQAQAIGQIFGKVTDPTGAVIPGVTVTVTGTGLQQPLVAVTTATGAYTFPSVPIGTYTLTFELSGFKKLTRPGIEITTGFSAMVDAKLELGTMAEDVRVSASAPVVDTKRTTTGGTFSREILDNIPTARDPWQIINMAPGVILSGVNVGGSASGQQLTPSVYGTSANVQWNLEGGSTTDMASNSSASYYNFDSFEQIQVVTGGGDVSVQSSGLFINLVTKSGSNVFRGTGTFTFSNDAMQGQNVSESLFNAGGSNGTGLSGNPLHKIQNWAAEYGGPIKKNRVWFWGSMDSQDINVGITNFFDTTQAGCNPPPTGYGNLQAVQDCLQNDQTTIMDLNGKVNYQLNSANKFQFLFTTDNKVRNHRSAANNTALEATYRQYSPNGIMGYFTPQLTHTLILSDKLVFTNQMTFVKGGFSLDYQDYDKCGASTPELAFGPPSDASCLFNSQTLRNRTVDYYSRGPVNVAYYERPTWEVKTDGTYFLSNFAGGDHQLKFGLGWRDARSLSFVHYGGGVSYAYMQCVGNLTANCGSSAPAPVGSATGLVPYQAVLSRDTLSNVDWWTWGSYLQDSYSKGKLRLNGGVRWDWQSSKLLGGCVAANPILPSVLPSQCQDSANPNLPFNNLSPRVSATYDLFGNGKTAVHASTSFYYDTRTALAGNLNNLSAVNLTWGSNQASGACSATAGASCWTDGNADGYIQAGELIGRPTSSTARFDTNTGILNNVVPLVDENLQIGRTREAIAGLDHDLGHRLHASFEYVYRYYDRGQASYLVGYTPNDPGYPASSVYSDRQVFVDPISGLSAPYYTVCQGCTRPTGTSITMTNPNWQTYNGITVGLERRPTARWQTQGSFTYNINRNYTPITGALSGGAIQNPTGVEFSDGTRSGVRFVAKANGSYQFGWGIRAGANWQIQDGAARNYSINGPGQVYGGTSGTVSYTTLKFENDGQHYLPVLNLLDLNATKMINLPGKKQQINLTFSAFNVFNVATIRGYSSGNLDAANFTQVTSIVAPRVFQAMVRLSF